MKWLTATLILFAILVLGILSFKILLKTGSRGNKPVTVGIAKWVDNPYHEKNILAFKKALAYAGYVEGKNIVYLEGVSNADPEKHKQLIRFFVSKKVDLIYSLTTPGTLLVKSIVTDIPVVFSIVIYPVETDLIKSNRNSGNNLVGTRPWVPMDVQLAKFRELVPGVTSIGFVHKKDEPSSTFQLQEFTRIANPLDIKVVDITPKDLSEIIPLLELSKDKIDTLYSACDTLIQGEQGDDYIIKFAQRNKIPDFTCGESGVRKGSLIGTVTDYSELGNLSGEKAAAILKGASPSSLETSTVSRPFVYINTKTAQLLNLEIPQNLFLEARELIE